MLCVILKLNGLQEHVVNFFPFMLRWLDSLKMAIKELFRPWFWYIPLIPNKPHPLQGAAPIFASPINGIMANIISLLWLRMDS